MLPVPRLRVGNAQSDPEAAGTSRPFIYGPENALLRVAATTSDSSCSYNPVFLYGPTGIGKTHLLTLFTGHFQLRHSNQTAHYLTASDFDRALSAARELDTLHDFRSRYRENHFLAIDDLSELAGRRHTQIELLDTIDELVDSGRQVYVASRQTLAECDDLLVGLKSRLAGGLTVPLARPCTAARRAIINQLADNFGLQLTEESLDFLAEPPPRIRQVLEMFSQISNLLAELANGTHSPATLEDVRAALTRLDAGSPIPTRKITVKTAKHFCLKVGDLTGPSRKQSVVVARGVAIYLMRRLSNESLENIGGQLGDRDHSTILHAYRKIDAAVAVDPTIRKSVNEIAAQLGVISLLG